MRSFPEYLTSYQLGSYFNNDEILFISEGEHIQMEINENEVSSYLTLSVIYTNLNTQKNLITTLDITRMGDNFLISTDWEYMNATVIDPAEFINPVMVSIEIINTSGEFGLNFFESRNITIEERENLRNATNEEILMRFTYDKQSGVIKEIYYATRLIHTNVKEKIFHIVNLEYFEPTSNLLIRAIESNTSTLKFPTYVSIISTYFMILIITKRNS